MPKKVEFLQRYSLLNSSKKSDILDELSYAASTFWDMIIFHEELPRLVDYLVDWVDYNI